MFALAFRVPAFRLPLGLKRSHGIRLGLGGFPFSRLWHVVVVDVLVA